MGKTNILEQILERIWIAVIGFLSNPETVSISSSATWYFWLKQKISRSVSAMSFFNSSIWSKHWRSLTACAGESAPSTAALTSSIGVLQCLSTKGTV